MTEEEQNSCFESFMEQLSRTPAVTEYFIAQCVARYQAGIDEFVDEEGSPLYLTRDNCAEGLEEAADGANYAIMESLKRFEEGKDEKRDLALKAAHLFAQAHFTLLQLQGADG
jgi:hypothetical protein